MPTEMTESGEEFISDEVRFVSERFAEALQAELEARPGAYDVPMPVVTMEEFCGVPVVSAVSMRPDDPADVTFQHVDSECPVCGADFVRENPQARNPLDAAALHLEDMEDDPDHKHTYMSVLSESNVTDEDIENLDDAEWKPWEPRGLER